LVGEADDWMAKERLRDMYRNPSVSSRVFSAPLMLDFQNKVGSTKPMIWEREEMKVIADIFLVLMTSITKLTNLAAMAKRRAC